MPTAMAGDDEHDADHAVERLNGDAVGQIAEHDEGKIDRDIDQPRDPVLAAVDAAAEAENKQIAANAICAGLSFDRSESSDAFNPAAIR